MRFSKSVCFAGIVACSVFSAAASAYEPGDFILRGGLARVVPNDSSNEVSANNVRLANTGVGVGSDTQVGLTGTYMLTKNVGVELLASTPFTHDIVAKGSTLASLGLTGKIGEVKHLPPTLSVQYYFDNPSVVTPYLGAGVNYTWVLEDSLTPDAQAALGTNDLKVSNSRGLAFEAGADVKLTDHLLVNVAVWRMNIESTAYIRHSALGDLEVNATIDPWVYMVGMGYKF